MAEICLQEMENSGLIYPIEHSNLCFVGYGYIVEPNQESVLTCFVEDLFSRCLAVDAPSRGARIINLSTDRSF
jgi:hypothetical protein